MNEPSNHRPADPASDDPREAEVVARLLRIAGPRPEPPSALERETRELAQAAWQAKTRRRRIRQRATWTALAASVVLAVTAVLRLGAPTVQHEGPIGVTDRVAGAVQLRTNTDGWRPLAGADSVLQAGDALRTGPQGRAGIRLAGGVSLRLDHATILHLASSQRIELEAGRVYIDSGHEASRDDGIAVVTPVGVARDIGTQFEVRYDGRFMRIRVREGRVDVANEATAGHATAGRELALSGSGELLHGEIAPSDPEWSWTEHLAPHFEIDGRPVIEYLRWVARETGRELRFTSAEAERAASIITLSGSLPGSVGPSESLDVVMPTTRFRVELQADAILVSLDEREMTR